MKHLIIIGAGGMGRSIYNLAINSIGYGVEFDVKGFLEPDANALDGFKGYPPILSNDDEYNICEDDVFSCSIGDVKKKVQICESLKQRGAIFKTLIHKNSSIGMNSIIGDGTIIDEGVHLDPDVTIGENCMIQTFAIIGHDSVIGEYSRIDSQCALVGGTIVGNRATLYTQSMINHNVVIEDDATVGACSFVIKKVKSGATVFGVPAKPIY